MTAGDLGRRRVHRSTASATGSSTRSSAPGHGDRLDDLDRFAALGIRTLRYPGPVGAARAATRRATIDWRWATRGSARLRALGIRPIVGLVHHGSGPRYTSLLDPDFPTRLADLRAARSPSAIRGSTTTRRSTSR